MKRYVCYKHFPSCFPLLFETIRDLRKASLEPQTADQNVQEQAHSNLVDCWMQGQPLDLVAEHQSPRCWLLTDLRHWVLTTLNLDWKF